MFVDFHILNELGSPSINSNTFANRPPAGQIGRLFVSTDTFEIYRDNGTSWDLIGGPGSSTVTGTGAATQVAFWTAAQAIGGSNNLWWDNTNGYLGVKTNAPTAGVNVVQTDGQAILSDFTTVAGSGNNAVAIYGRNTTNSSGYVAVLEEKTPNSASGQYPIKIMHSLSSGTAAANMATGIHFSLPDNAGTERINQFSMDTVDPAAATYSSRYRFVLRQNGSAATPFYITGTGIGVFTGTPTSALDVHSTGVIAQLNSTGTTNNSYLAFQRNGSGVWRLGDNYNGGNNQFEIHNTVLTVDAVTINAATNKTSWQAQQTYTSGLARGNYFDFNLSVSAGGSFSSPNAITALGASLDLTLAGNATIPSGARSGLDAYNSISFTGTGTLTHNQGTQIRAYSNVTAGWAFGGSATGTITHLAGLRALFPDNSGSAVTITNNYALLLNDQTANTGTVTYTNRWGVYQEGASDLNYFAATTLIGSTVNNGYKLQVNGDISFPYGNILRAVNGTYDKLIETGYNGTSDFVNIYTAGNNAGNANAKITMLANGNVGIGTTSPSDKLHVKSGNIITEGVSGGGAYNLLNVVTGSTDARNWSIGASISSFGDFGIKQSNAKDGDPIAAGTTRFYISNTGNVGIGTSSPNSAGVDRALTINGSSNSILELNYGGTRGSYLFSNNSNTVLSSVQALDLVFKTTDTERARITAGGNFLIGTTTDAGYKLDVNGSIKVNNNVVLSSGYVQIINSTNAGLYLNNGSTQWQVYNNTSDEFIINNGAGTSVLSIPRLSGAATFSSSITTGAPTGGTAAAWKLGSYKAAAVVVSTTNYIEVDIGGTLYKLAVVT